MLERFKSNETTRSQIPIRIIYGSHGDDNESVANLNFLNTEIDDKLKKTQNGNIVVFVEDASSSKKESKKIEKLVGKGYEPTKSVLSTKFNIDPSNFEQKFVYKVFTGQIKYPIFDSSFSKKLFEVLDENYIKNKRIRLLWERDFAFSDLINVITFLVGVNKNIKANSSFKRAVNSIYKGEFKKGIKFYKKYMEFYSEYQRNREDRLVNRISDSVEDNNTSAITGYIGSVHTRIGHNLKKKGYDSRGIYTGMENGSYIWLKSNQLLRLKLLTPNYEPSEIEWFQYVISNAVSKYFENKLNHLSDQKQNRYMNTIIDNFVDLETINIFEQDVKKQGFNQALKDFIKTKMDKPIPSNGH